MRKNRRKNQSKSYSELFISALRFPFTYPMLFITFLILTVGLFFIGRKTLIEDNNKTDSVFKDSYGDILNRVKDRCQTMPFQSGNKVPGIRLDLVGDEYYPAICAKNIQQQGKFGEQCKKLIAKRISFMKSSIFVENKHKILEIRDIVGQKLATETSVDSATYNKIYQPLSKEGQKKFEEFNHRITFLRGMQLTDLEARKVNLGACGEQTLSAIKDILEIGQQNNVSIHPRYVTLQKNNGQAHDFVIIAGSGSDKHIKNNKTRTTIHLNNLHNGYICDSWNEGYFEKANTNTYNLYRQGWGSVITEEISLDFDYQGLSSEAIQFLDNRLSRLGLKNLHGSPTL